MATTVFLRTLGCIASSPKLPSTMVDTFPSLAVCTCEGKYRSSVDAREPQNPVSSSPLSPTALGRKWERGGRNWGTGHRVREKGKGLWGVESTLAVTSTGGP
eukprot:6341329-Pyramimonas_sp.AAC.1